MTEHFIPPNEEQKRAIFQACRIVSEDQLKNDAKALREWLRHQPHLPQDVSDITLQVMLVQKKNSMEEAKKQLDRYYSDRALIPEFFDDQDPQSEDLQRNIDVIYQGTCSRMTPQGERITITKLRDPTTDKFNPNLVLKRTVMIGDLRIKFETLEGGEILVFDFEGATFSHMSECTPTIGKKMLDVIKLIPMRLKLALFINAPPGLETLVYIVKQILPEKLQKRIFVYSGYKSIYNHIPRELLPKDYGGDDLSLEEMTEAWRKELLDNREFFLDQSKRRSDESKRLKGSGTNPKDRFSTPGSFKSLTID